MKEVVLIANRRSLVGKQVNGLRRDGKLPGVIYGRHVQAIPIMLDLKETSRILQGLPSSALVVVEVDGEKHFALVREKQRNPILSSLRHIDFQAISLTEKVRINVPLHLVGESPAVKNFGGILVSNIDRVEVECLPRELPNNIAVDVSSLMQIGSVLHVRDLILPKGVVIYADLDEVIVVVTAPIAEEVPEEAAAETIEPELVEKKKKEEVEEE